MHHWQDLNYQQLLAFWTVSQEGTIAAASRRLLVSRPAVSMQVKALETTLGVPLFTRHGPRLQLTDAGQLVRGYADTIFDTGRELLEALHGQETGRPTLFRVGIADVMSKLVAFQLLESVLVEQDRPVRLICHEDSPRRLFAALAVHDLDLVLSDIPLLPGIDVKAFHHTLGTSPTTIFGADAFAPLAAGFPASLDGAPFLLPSKESAIRGGLEAWFDQCGVRPRVVAEFDDSALLKVFGQAGHGLFSAPSTVADHVRRRYDVQAIGVAPVNETFYAVSPERRVKHPVVAQLIRHAQARLQR
ncbi:MAG: LysR family transcriptional regulator [Planctomyces sp.]|nr:LysR family transcriptional regulator [Planctomyces sp.]